MNFQPRFDPDTHAYLARKIDDGLVRNRVPMGCRGGLTRYLLYGVSTGGFLHAVIDNDLKEAVGRADDVNILAIPNIVRFLYNAAPSQAWGRKGAHDAWVKGVQS
jgi:hypothetical protein